jgi:YggT family protein
MLILLLDLYSLVLLASVVLSWVQVSDDNAFVKIVRQLTEPVLEPVRKIVPPVGGFDLSPVLVILALNLLKALLYRL